MSLRFSPYVDNGGTTLAIPGDGFVVVASDTRLSLGFGIQSRNVSKVTKLTDRAVILSAGMQADAQTLHKLLNTRTTMFEHTHKKTISLPAIAQMLSNTLYFRRFFPFYTFNILAGLTEEGEGRVYGYDAIGSYESVPAASFGSGQSLIQPLLDNQIAYKNRVIKPPKMSLGETVDFVKDAFTSAGERDIFTGDSVHICVITKEGIREEYFDLKFD
eukprot:gb/GECH01011733.1/.p1 GENE.gb/GECH01011733.1/~~gb/GECH01011733.1/.p1  ORF type:complete len:216 (+),score=42.21 gb/GECH01011733.1/:1-648(+)